MLPNPDHLTHVTGPHLAGHHEQEGGDEATFDRSLLRTPAPGPAVLQEVLDDILASHLLGNPLQLSLLDPEKCQECVSKRNDIIGEENLLDISLTYLHHPHRQRYRSSSTPILCLSVEKMEHGRKGV